MLHQKKTWNGPVYSEGNNHWYYCGLTDGNYAQDQVARLFGKPWLVDFDLRKMHPLCCNFGMGNLGMFYGSGTPLHGKPGVWDANLDRFLAATLAFGHTGFLVREGGMEGTVRSYFCLQQLHARYALDTIDTIRYADENGTLLETDQAVASGAYRRSQVALKYSDGLEVYVNGNKTESWTVDGRTLPPNGWLVKDPVKNELVAESLLYAGHRVDYVDSPAYLYADGRGRFTRFARLACAGPLIAHKRDGGILDVIPVGAHKEFAVAFDGRGADVTALDRDGKDLGPGRGPPEPRVRLRQAEGRGVPLSDDTDGKTGNGTQVRPCRRRPGRDGRGRREEEARSAYPGRREAGQPGLEAARRGVDRLHDPTAGGGRPAIGEGYAALLTLTSNLADVAEANVTLGGEKQTVRLEPNKPVSAHLCSCPADRRGGPRVPHFQSKRVNWTFRGRTT